MKQALVIPVQYFWEKDGEPLAFGKVYFYHAGTTIPKDTFTSESGDTPNANPVVLNSEGYASIYLQGSYSVVVDNADDANIWSADPVSSLGATTNQAAATYLSPTSFQLFGDQTEQYRTGRGVKIDNGTLTPAYTTVASSSAAGGRTTVVVDDSVVGVNIASVETWDAATNVQSIQNQIISEEAARKAGDLAENTARTAGDANLQAQISLAAPLEASQFSPIAWHDQEIANSVTIPDNKNAWSFGPTMSIAAGQTVTIGDNSFWTIANGAVI
jgi:hypothetical protein